MRVEFLGVATDFDTHCGGATQTEVEKNQVGNLLLQQTPESRLTIGGTNHFGLRDV